MAKLTRTQTKRHKAALDLLTQDRLTEHQQEQVFRDFHPGADHMTAESGAFFTPFDLAGDLALEISGATRILDVCAGIGVLSAFAYWRSGYANRDAPPVDIVCLERNSAYVEIGKQLCPWARWITGDVFDFGPEDLGHFDIVIGNPPFGRVRRSANGPRYTGAETELHIIDHVARFATRGAFIIPAMSAPFQYSGVQCYARRTEGRGVDFERQTGITLDVGVGVDCSYYADQWQDVSPSVEIVSADFSEARPVQAPLDLFEAVA